MCLADENKIPSLPLEVWVHIFSFLTPESLHKCQCVCAPWRAEILRLINSGKIPRLGLRLERLKFDPKTLCEYRRSTWESLSVCVDKPILIVGIGVYVPYGESIIAVDARPLTEPLREIDVSTELDSIYEEDEKITTLFGMPGCKKPFRFRLEPGAWWEIVLNIKPRGPRTLNGDKMVWSGGGIGGKVELQSHGVNFSFRKTVREGWVSEYSFGQFPLIYFWRL